jgi:hypothetical protein
MSARLGYVLYWAGNAVVLAWAMIMAFAWFVAVPEGDARLFAWVLLIPTVIIWLIGRACLYVLAAR